MSTKRTTKSPGQFSKGASGNPSGRPPGSRNHATVLMESLLEGEAEQLTRKAIEMALAGDITALRLCLERIIPARKDRPIHLSLPPIENVQQISLAMARVSAAISEGEITPSEGEVLSNVLADHKTVLVTGDLERRMDELERRITHKNGTDPMPPYTSEVQAGNPRRGLGANMTFANRLQRLEKRLGPPPHPLSQQVMVRAWASSFSTEELNSMAERWEASGASGFKSLLEIFGEGTPERQEVLGRIKPALDEIALEMTGKLFAELLREEAKGEQ